MTNLKTPSSLENDSLEQDLLANLFLMPDQYFKSEGLKAELFICPNHKIIWQVIEEVANESKSTDGYLIASRFNHNPDMQNYITQLCSDVSRVSVKATESLIEALTNLWTLREQYTVIQEAQTLLTETLNPSKVSAFLEEKLFYVFSKSQKGGAQHIDVYIEQEKAGVRKAHELALEDKSVGISTGIKALDDALTCGGFVNSDLYIIGGRPSMGKTSLALNMAFHAANSGKTVYLQSLEMAGQQLTAREIVSRMPLDSFPQEIRKGTKSIARVELYEEHANKLKGLPFYIDESGSIDIQTIIKRAMYMKQKNDIDIIFIDFLQQIQPKQKSQKYRTHEIEEQVVALKGLAKDLNIPIVLLSQLSREVEGRDDKRPQLSDLRESGAIEQSADTVIFTFRSEYYKNAEQEKSLEGKGAPQSQKNKSPAIKGDWLLIRKQRHGIQNADVEVRFDSTRTCFTDKEDFNRD